MKLKTTKRSMAVKVLIVFCLGFSLKLFFSCTPSAPLDMTYNYATVKGIDNSGCYLRTHSSVDTMYAEALALELMLADTLLYYYVSNFVDVKRAFSFSYVNAMSYEPSYIPVNKVDRINIITLFDIDANTKAGDDVTADFLFAGGYDFDLYKDLDHAISDLNTGNYGSSSSSVSLILQRSVQASQAQFEVDITFEDGEVLSCVTDTFIIVNP